MAHELRSSFFFLCLLFGIVSRCNSPFKNVQIFSENVTFHHSAVHSSSADISIYMLTCCCMSPIYSSIVLRSLWPVHSGFCHHTHTHFLPRLLASRCLSTLSSVEKVVSSFALSRQFRFASEHSKTSWFVWQTQMLLNSQSPGSLPASYLVMHYSHPLPASPF